MKPTTIAFITAVLLANVAVTASARQQTDNVARAAAERSNGSTLVDAIELERRHLDDRGFPQYSS